MRTLTLMTALCFALGGCAWKAAQPAPSEKLYFAVEVRREGKLIGHPKLLGETGKLLRAERRQPGAALPDYQLVLKPTDRGDRYHLVLDLQLPERSGHSELALLHGEERRLELGEHDGDLEVSLLLMRVDSPEFRALMDLSAQAPPTGPKSI
jgi:hypothetical protein